MRRVQIVTAACAALMWTSVAAAQTPAGGGSAQGGSQAGSSAGISTATSGVDDRDAGMTGRTTARGDKDNDLRKFVERAAMSDMAEVQLGRLALQQAQDPQVKQFAQQMVDEHSRSLEQLRSLASSHNVQLASSLDSKHQKKHDKLAKLQGAEFDRAYMDAMVDAHKDAEKLLAKRAGDKASQSASSMNQQGMPGASATGDSGATATTGAVGTSGTSSTGATTGTSGSSSTVPSSERENATSADETAAPAETSGATSGSTEAGTPSVGTPGTTATPGASSGMGPGSVAGTTGTSGSMGASAVGATPASIDEWAAMALPKVRMHLEHARLLEDQVEKAGRANNSNNSVNRDANVPGQTDPSQTRDDQDEDKAPKPPRAGGGNDPSSSTPPQQ